MTGARSSHRIVVLAMLLLVYTFNFIDRQILGILAPAIKADLHLSDSQLGMLAGWRSRSCIRRWRSRWRGSPTGPAGRG